MMTDASFHRNLLYVRLEGTLLHDPFLLHFHIILQCFLDSLEKWIVDRPGSESLQWDREQSMLISLVLHSRC